MMRLHSENTTEKTGPQNNGVGARFVKNTGWLIFGKIFHMLLSLVVTGMVSRYLGVSGYGTLNYGLAFVEVFTVICRLGLDGIIVHAFVKARNAAENGNPDESGKILGTAIGLRLVSSLLGILITWLFVSILQPGKTVLIAVTLIQSVSLLFVAFDTIEYYYQSLLRSKTAVLARNIAYTAVCGFRLVMIFLQADLVYFGWATVLDALLIGLLLYLFYRHDQYPRLRCSFDTAKMLLSRSYHFIAVDLLVTIYTQMDRIMVGTLSNESEVGLYAAGMLISNLWIFIPVALLDSGRPVIMERKAAEDEDGYQKRLRQVCCGILWISILAGIVFSLFGWLAIRVIYGSQYAGAVPVLGILIWSRLFSQMGAVRSVWMLCEGMEHKIKYFIGLGAAVNLVLNALLIPRIGAIGAAAATLVTEVVSSAAATAIYPGTREFVRIWFGSLTETRNITDHIFKRGK